MKQFFMKIFKDPVVQLTVATRLMDAAVRYARAFVIVLAEELEGKGKEDKKL